MEETTFNRYMLLLARQARGMNQQDLAAKAGLTQGHLSKLENGLSESPSPEIVAGFSKALDYPVEFFYQPERVYDPISLHEVRHRKRAATPKRELEIVHAQTNIAVIQIRKLLSSFDFHGEYEIPSFDPDDFEGNIEAIADMVRRVWKLPRGPAENLTQTVERGGAIVVIRDMGNTGVFGLTIHLPKTPPVIFLNTRQPADRMRFTLAHEIGHIVMHQVPTPEMEEEADTFAAALLMPGNDIRSAFMGRVGLPLLARLKPVWRVSMQSLLERAYSIGAINENQRRYLWQQISANRLRTHEPAELDFEPERPGALSAVVDVYLKQLGYNVSDVARLVAYSEEEFERDYGIPRSGRSAPQLRVIS